MKQFNPTNPKPIAPFKVLIMGDPGTRKTTLGLQFPNLHVFDCDHNLDGPIRALTKGMKDVKPLLPNLSFTYDDCRNDEEGKPLEIEECFDRTSDLLKRAATDVAYKDVHTYLLDSLSHVNEFVIRKVMRLKNKPSMEINLWSDFATQAYTILVARLDMLVSQGKNVICTCHQERISEPDKANIMIKKIIEVNPLFSGRVGDSIGAFFTDVWRLRKGSASGGRVEVILETDFSPMCSHLKNSLGLPKEIDVSNGIGALMPYLQGRI